jgi:hypothetical protein
MVLVVVVMVMSAYMMRLYNPLVCCDVELWSGWWPEVDKEQGSSTRQTQPLIDPLKT